MHASSFGSARRILELRALDLERGQALGELLQGAFVETSTDAPGVDDHAVFTHTEQQCSQVSARATGLGEAHDHEFLARARLALLPVLAAPGVIAGILALRNDAL